MAYYSGLVCIAPYLNVYYKRLGISERQIGFLAALSPWVNASSGMTVLPSVPAASVLEPLLNQCRGNLGRSC